jgi:hypothetical protein
MSTDLEQKISKVRDLLRDEFNRGHRLDSPWDCTEPECLNFGRPMYKSCGCYQASTKEHIEKVIREIDQS